jgi:hypothetical protein
MAEKLSCQWVLILIHNVFAVEFREPAFAGVYRRLFCPENLAAWQPSILAFYDVDLGRAGILESSGVSGLSLQASKILSKTSLLRLKKGNYDYFPSSGYNRLAAQL